MKHSSAYQWKLCRKLLLGGVLSLAVLSLSACQLPDGLQKLMDRTEDSSSGLSAVSQLGTNGWEQDELGYRYFYNGSYLQGQWEQIDDKWYYFDDLGYLHFGWLEYNGSWYFLTQDGSMATGTLTMNGQRHEFSENGVLISSVDDIQWVKDKDGWHLEYSDGGLPEPGWGKYNKRWYYFTEGGHYTTGWMEQDGVTYYLADGGAMAVGWCDVDGVRYYFDHSGAMQTGWIKLGDQFYYLSASGAMQTGWLEDSGSWYYLDPEAGWNWKRAGTTWTRPAAPCRPAG